MSAAAFDAPPVPASRPSAESLRDVLRSERERILLADARADVSGRVDPELLGLLRSAGFFSATVPASLGGPGLSLLEATQLLAGLAALSPSAALLCAMPLGTLAITGLPESFVPAGQREAFRARIRLMAEQALAGRIFGVANTEPGTGGDLANTRTRSVRGSDGIVRLHGFKSFASFAGSADVWMSSARDEEGHVDAYLVSSRAPGLRYTSTWDAVGMRGTESIGVHLEGAPAEDLLGYRGMLEGPNARHFSTLGFAAVFTGIARAALEEGRPAASQSAWAGVRLAEAAMRTEAAAALVESVAREGGDWPLPPGYRTRAVMAKTFAAETAVAVAETANLALGGRVYGTANGGRAARLLRDALSGPLLRPPLPLAYQEIARALAEG
ncbi:MAG: acyl-CoA/acyl-ACP dehydrogenase [Acidobacteria bacterium]|nr:acyl-CoA/acyl-ACP dehydrogenase [Acidobacteriota bacterium]